MGRPFPESVSDEGFSVFLNQALDSYMQDNKGYIAARLQTALALLERLREFPTLTLSDHKLPSSSSIISHESFGDRAHKRWELKKINSNHGRRSNNCEAWGPHLLALLQSEGFEIASENERTRLIDEFQLAAADILRSLLEANPIIVTTSNRSAEAVIADVLQQAADKGKCGDVAQYLVGAKLMRRLRRDMPVYPANKGDRKSLTDPSPRSGDYDVEDATIEIATGIPDEKHLSQVEPAIATSGVQVWLLTRQKYVANWKTALDERLGIDVRRVVVTSVESFVGQNLSEMGDFSAKGIAAQLETLFELYNTRWIQAVGTPGMRIEVK